MEVNMKSNTRRIAVAALLVLGLTLGACQPRNAAPDVAADEAAIRKVLDGIASTFNAGDYDGMYAFYRDDVVVYPPNAPDVVGKQAWRDALNASLPPSLALKMRFDTQELEIAGDLAYERGTYQIEISDKATGAAMPPTGGRHIHIFKREADGSWKGWRLMENSAEPAAPAAPAAPTVAPKP
jgi:ketosteroid isomerase-like protein